MRRARSRKLLWPAAIARKGQSIDADSTGSLCTALSDARFQALVAPPISPIEPDVPPDSGLRAIFMRAEFEVTIRRAWTRALRPRRWWNESPCADPFEASFGLGHRVGVHSADAAWRANPEAAGVGVRCIQRAALDVARRRLQQRQQRRGSRHVCAESDWMASDVQAAL